MNNIVAQWGATYPVAYAYDSAGRKVAMATTRNLVLANTNFWQVSPNWPLITNHPTLDMTHWFYDAPTGLLTQKLYADGKVTSYTYTPDGRLATRTWARGITTSYTYDALGQLTHNESGHDN